MRWLAAPHKRRSPLPQCSLISGPDSRAVSAALTEAAGTCGVRGVLGQDASLLDEIVGILGEPCNDRSEARAAMCNTDTDSTHPLHLPRSLSSRVTSRSPRKPRKGPACWSLQVTWQDLSHLLQPHRIAPRAQDPTGTSGAGEREPTRPKKEIDMPHRIYRLVDAHGRTAERKQTGGVAMARVYYDIREREGNEVWVEVADRSVRWRQSASEVHSGCRRFRRFRGDVCPGVGCSQAVGNVCAGRFGGSLARDRRWACIVLWGAE